MLALVVVADEANVELVSAELWALGVVAVEERVGQQSGTVELWTSLGDDVDSIAPSIGAIDHVLAWWFEHVDEAIAETWREHAEPTWVADDVVVHPAWRDPPPAGGADTIVISIEPGSTFGMGDHPTTVLSMRVLRDAVTPGAHVLDVGCGSGVLAIASCRFGAAAADAIDISPASVPVTTANAERNGVGDRVSVSTTPLAEIEGTYDVVVANILAPTLIDLADDLVRVLAEDGYLVISGILAERFEHVVAALAPLRQIRRDDLDGWTAIMLGR